jgi:co-chaperonin GroES (HSP10)
MTKEEKIAELAKIPIVDGFEMPPGLPIPYGSYIVGRILPQEEQKTISGIILTGGETLKTFIVLVYGVGESVNYPFKVGTKVLTSKQVTYGFVWEGKEYSVIPEHEIYCTLPPKTYIYPYIKDSNHKRRENRIAGVKAADDRDYNKFEERMEKEEERIKKRDKITPEKPKENVTIIKEK